MSCKQRRMLWPSVSSGWLIGQDVAVIDNASAMLKMKDELLAELPWVFPGHVVCVVFLLKDVEDEGVSLCALC